MTDALMDRIKAHRSAPTVYDPPTFEQMADYIQELTLQLLATSGQAADALDKAVVAEAKLATCEKYRDAYAECDRIGTQAVRDLEAKLTKAVAFIRRHIPDSVYEQRQRANAFLAELEVKE